MNRSSVIGAATMLAWALVGFSSGAQEAVSPATAAATDSATNSTSEPATPPAANSKVRIVRLSEVKGEVQLDRLTGKGFEAAMANLPVIEGARLKTGNGVAEVEFEDNSTVRLGPNSVVEFPRLELLPGGIKASTVNVQQGMVYVSLVNAKGNQLSVKFGQQTVNLPPDSHIRLQVTPTQADLAVMHGDVTVEAPTGTTNVDKNRTATFNLAGQGEPTIAKSLTDEPLDKWDSNAAQYHKSYANASAFTGSPYAYGVNDMNYYGSFVSGCGASLWRPYFTSAAWDPFSSGTWAYYSGAGYSWVSPYPWGWTPYHYGSWSFCQGIGWGWAPGGSWLGLANTSFVNPTGFANSFAGTRPHPPVSRPAASESSLVGVNLKAIPASSMSGEDKFVFRNNSAGMGVPRGSLGKLNGFSNHVAEHGMASANVFSPAAAARAGNAGQQSSGFSPANAGLASSSRAPSSSMQSMGSGSSHVQSGGGGPSGGGGGHR
jgi:FecR protein